MAKPLFVKKIQRSLYNQPFLWKRYWNGNFHDANQQVYPHLAGVLNDMRTRGIAFARLEDVLPDESLAQLEQEARLRRDEYYAHGKKDATDNKRFAHFVLGFKPVPQGNEYFANLANHPTLRSLAQAYFEMNKVSLRYFNVWSHVPTGNPPEDSQLWHRDRDDLRIMKVFIYLNDVNELQDGPFIYAPGTHQTGPIQQQPDYQIIKDVKRTNDSQMDAVVPKNQWVVASGTKGTIVFADTHGMHKGGYVQRGERLLFTCMYLSPLRGKDLMEG
jgi:hypothetical protein